MMRVTVKNILFILGLAFFSIEAFATTEVSTIHWFYIIQGLFLLLIFLVYPIISSRKKEHSASLRGLNLPQGSVRAIVAIAIIGSYLITLSIGSFFIEKEHFDMILTAFGSLSGAVIGFYFGSGGSGGTQK